MTARNLGRPVRGRAELAADVQRIREAMQDFLRAYPAPNSPSLAFPKVNVTEDHAHLYVRTWVPGVKPSDLEVSTAARTLIVAGKRSKPDAGVHWHREERVYGAFHRTLTLPADFHGDQADANLSEGVLTVTLPKTESAKGRRIPIRN